MSKNIEMTQAQKDTIHDLRMAGFAIVIFNPEELGEVEPRLVQNRLVELGNEVISDLTEEP